MRLLIILIVIPVLLLGQKLFIQKQHIVLPVKQSQKKAMLPTSIPTVTTNVTPSIMPLAFPDTTSPTISYSPSMTNAPTNNDTTDTNSLIYPEAKQTSNNGSTINLESYDDAQTITNWYKEKIKNLGWNTTSIVQNNVNDTVNNQLVAANGNQQVKISITRKSGESVVNISVIAQ